MIITINTKTREIREKWSEEDRQMEYRDVQRKKLEAVSMALGAQLVIMYASNKARIRMLAVIFTHLIDSMKNATRADLTDCEEN